MSATLAPETVSPENPISAKDVVDTLAKLNLTVSKPQDLADFTSLLTGIWEMWNTIDKADDYVPTVDEERFPRKDVHRPEGAENETNAWAWKCDIRDATEASKTGLLAGKTVNMKDNIAVKGVPCLLGTNVFQDWVPNTDATIVTRILEAGGIVSGKAVCENMSMWGVSTSAATGQMSNVWAEGFSAGGSSSGTGVLVGKGITWGGMGGDQGGSIRIPSACNGIVGLKPTTGLVPYTGIASLEPIIDSTGPMTMTVLDNALLLQATAGADFIDDRQQAGCPLPGQVPDYPALAKTGAKGLRIGILKEGFDQPLADERLSALVAKAAKALETLGCVVEEVSVPMHKMGPTLWTAPGRMSGHASLLAKNVGRRTLHLNDLTDKVLPLTQDKFDRMFAGNSNAVVTGQWAWDHLPPTLLGKAMNLIRKLRDDYYAALDKYDVLVMPTMPMLAPKLPSTDSTIVEFMHNSNGVSLNTSAFNLTGLPALSLPVGFLPSLQDPNPKLPVGMMIVSKFYEEATIYRVAYAWEQAFDWKTFE
ncbi:hypothetical protein SBRCBS47491_006135 [Sporothrix bragantina]|uniref:Amidase domain-containing protein n=1 Tax=Sporothrix bragantina TaxID=671064 RepID=A0ABP0C3A2_9PEZI